MARLLLVVVALQFAVACASWDPNMVEDREVMVNLMSWKWTDIAKECERYVSAT